MLTLIVNHGPPTTKKTSGVASVAKQGNTELHDPKGTEDKIGGQAMSKKRMMVEEIAEWLYDASIVKDRWGIEWANLSDSIQYEWIGVAKEAELLFDKEKRDFARQEAEPLVMAVKFYANKEQYTNMGFNGEPTPIYHDRGAVAKEALTAWREKYGEGKK